MNVIDTGEHQPFNSTFDFIFFCICRVQRLPGIDSSRLGLDSLSGRLDEFEVDSYMNRTTDSEAIRTGMHSVMEAQLSLQTKPASRGI